MKVIFQKLEAEGTNKVCVLLRSPDRLNWNPRTFSGGQKGGGETH